KALRRSWHGLSEVRPSMGHPGQHALERATSFDRPASACRVLGQLRRALAPFQICSKTCSAGSERAIAQDWPAHACIRWTSPSLPACALMVAVSPRWTGYGAGFGAVAATAARM